MATTVDLLFILSFLIGSSYIFLPYESHVKYNPVFVLPYDYQVFTGIIFLILSFYINKIK